MYLGPQFQLANGIVRFNIFITHLTCPPLLHKKRDVIFVLVRILTCLFQIASGALLN